MALALAYFRYSFTSKPSAAGKQALSTKYPPASGSAFLLKALPFPKHSKAGARALLFARTKFEMKQVLVSPAFTILMLWGLFTTLLTLVSQRDIDGRPTYPTTVSMIPELEGALFLIPSIVVIIYAGELVWGERSRRMHEIIDATALPNWAYVVPKAAAVTMVLFCIFMVSVIASLGVQLSLGFTRLELDQYLLWYVLPQTYDMLLLTALAVLVQAVSPHKIVGWGVMILFLVPQFASLAPDHNLLNYGSAHGCFGSTGVLWQSYCSSRPIFFGDAGPKPGCDRGFDSLYGG
jgi:hypothetical protein